MKITLIGYGYWGKKIYKILNKFYPEKNIFIVDPYIKNISHKIEIKTFKYILSREDVKHVLIATPEETHYKIALECLKNKKNIFVEKPLCLKKYEAEKLQQLAKKNNLKIFVDYIFLYDPYVKKIKEIIQKNILGDLLQIKSIRHSINIDKPNISVFDDLAIHDIYLGEYFFEKKTNKIKVIKKIITSEQIREAKAAFYYGKKILLTEYSWIQPTPKRIMTFIGDKANLIWDKNEKNLLIHQNKELIKKIKVTKTSSPLELSIEKFLSEKNTYDYTKDTKILENLNHS